MDEPKASTWPLVMMVASCGLVSLALSGLAHGQLVGKLDLLYIEVAKTVVDRYVAACERERPLARVTDECRDVYLTLSQLQKADELVAPELKQVPTDIIGLQELPAVRATGFAVVHEPFERAAKRIREQVLPHASDRSITPAESSKSMGAA